MRSVVRGILAGAVLAMLCIPWEESLRAQDAGDAEGDKKAVEVPVDLRRFADDMKFENAMQFFRMKDGDRALVEFKEYLEIYIRGAHRGEAYRGIAKIYFERYDYERSARAYGAIYEEASASEDGIDAWYHAGLCYQKMGEDEKARSIFGEIVQKYPYSNSRQPAQVQLDMIKIFSK